MKRWLVVLLLAQTACVPTGRTPLARAADYLWAQQAPDGGWHSRTYGLLLLRRGDLPAAEAQLLQSLSSLEHAYGNQEHPNVHETRRALMAFYRETGRPELVERYRAPDGRFIPY